MTKKKYGWAYPNGWIDTSAYITTMTYDGVIKVYCEIKEGSNGLEYHPVAIEDLPYGEPT